MPDSASAAAAKVLAQELCDAVERGHLNAVEIEVIAEWIHLALSLEKEAVQISFVKNLILKAQAGVEAEHSTFEITHLMPHFERSGRPGEAIVHAALMELVDEGKITCVDPGRPATFAFPGK